MAARRAGLLVLLGAFAAAQPAPAAERALGRLFFTPAQRASLDSARAQRTRATVATEKLAEEPQPVPEVVSLSGIVRRSDGTAIVWINNRAVAEKEPAAGAPLVNRVRPDGAVTLEVPQSGRRIELKVGQRAELLSGSVLEGYTRASAAKPEPKPPATPGGKPAPAEAAKAEREERQRELVEEAVARALQEAAAARAAPAAPGPARGGY